MKIKLKKGEYLESSGSHQGFPVSIWSKLNAGETVEVDSIPARAVNKVVKVATKKKKGVKDGNK